MHTGKPVPDSSCRFTANPGILQYTGKGSFSYKMTPDQDTIAAIATPGGRGGIGIIKISGSKSFPIARSIFRPGDSNLGLVSGAVGAGQKSEPLEFETHRIYHGHIVDPDNRRLLDEVLVSAMKAPRTYTREDVVEINAHGGAVVLHAILKLVLRKGARFAEAGEFTKRAFLNGAHRSYPGRSGYRYYKCAHPRKSGTCNRPGDRPAPPDAGFHQKPVNRHINPG